MSGTDTEIQIFEVDTNANEDSIYHGLKDLPLNLCVKRRRLDVGDILVTYSQGTIVFERKTWSDLRSSIVDTRHVDQKMRIKKYMEDCMEQNPESFVRTIYIIEGDMPSWTAKPLHSKLPNSRLYQTLFLTQIRDGMEVIYLKTSEDICKAIAYIANKALCGEFKQSAKREVGGMVAKSYKKRKNLESESNWFNMLCAIQGVGEKKARSITGAYPSARSLIDEYFLHEGSRAQRIDVISKISGGKKAIGKAVSEKIHDAIYSDTTSKT